MKGGVMTKRDREILEEAADLVMTCATTAFGAVVFFLGNDAGRMDYLCKDTFGVPLWQYLHVEPWTREQAHDLLIALSVMG